MKSYERKDFIHVSWPDLSIFQHSLLTWKNHSLHTFCGQVKIFLYQTMFIPILLRVMKRSEPRGEQLQGKARNTALVGSLREQGWYNIKKVSRPFPLLSFDWYYIMHLCSFSCFMDHIFWNSWNLLSFIGQVMISGIQFDNSTQEEMPTLQIEYSTLIEENEGLYFLDCKEEGRALIFRSMTSDQWFSQNACFLKPQQCINISWWI